MRQKLAPFVVQHGLEPLPGYVARPERRGRRDFLVVAEMVLATVRRRLLLQGTSAATPSGADFGEGTEGGCIKIQGERFVVSVGVFSVKA